jgi:hypothetical protein
MKFENIIGQTAIKEKLGKAIRAIALAILICFMAFRVQENLD